MKIQGSTPITGIINSHERRISMIEFVGAALVLVYFKKLVAKILIHKTDNFS